MRISSATVLAPFLLVFFVSGALATESKVTVDVNLVPAGNFQLTTAKVQGFAQKTAAGYKAENIIVDITGVETGVSLRDKHTRKELGAPKYKTVKLLKASGSRGKGTGVIEVKGKKQNVSGTYKISGGVLNAEFKMQLAPLGVKANYMGVGVQDEVLVHVIIPIKEVTRKTASKGK